MNKLQCPLTSKSNKNRLARPMVLKIHIQGSQKLNEPSSKQMTMVLTKLEFFFFK
jgi:hypothetical protein